jgi:predicted dinucleotide-binding enzyme
VEAATAADIAVVTIPLRAIATVPVEPLAGKIVLDTNNYYPQRDGQIAELDDATATVSGLLQRHLPSSKVVKAFNHIRSAEITTAGTPSGSADRRALAVSSDFPEATIFVTALYDAIGFDAVDVGPLAESWRVERDQPAYVVRQNAEELRANLALATR